MSILIIFKIAALGILIAVLQMILNQSGKQQLTMLIDLAGLILILFWIVPYVSDIFNMVTSLFSF